MKKRALTAVALGAAFALTLAGCAPGGNSANGGSEGSGDEAVTLKVWSWQAQSSPQWNKIFDAYEKDNPGVTIEFEGFQPTEYNQILATGLEGRDGPDVAMLRAYGGLQNAVAAGQLLPVGDKITGLDQIAPSVMAAATGKADGLVYGVPFATQTLQMIYNKTLFEKEGLKAPKTWEEFISLNDSLLEKQITPMALGAREDWVLPIFADIMGSARYGGSEFEAAVLDGSQNFNDPNYVASLQVVKDMQKYLDKDVMAVGVADSALQFTSGKAAQYPGGSFDLKTFKEGAPDTEFGVYQVPPPPGSVLDHPVTPAYADGSFGVNKQSKKQEASLKLLQWMTTKDFGQQVSNQIGQFSPLPGVTYEDKLLQEMWDLYEENPAPYLLLINFRYGDPSGTTVLGTNIQKMFLGESTPAEVADALQVGVSAWFTPSK
ncbi:ABC transporter substrate-binding protein [Mycetocola spongiae]|uniref:ABC transporter substrate-binding protein n=1 Tax=Mycetocola spongiae TaxID=2859226 RepID=UPI001CF30E37|nr:extracellular solute-binding protein [Mycetocola spongiae]UCR89620.1 extracellular solute-binding protein [Mycetocola spongiae]